MTSVKNSHVYYACTVQGAAVLDARPFRGRWRFMDPLSVELWQAALDGTPVREAIDTVSRRIAAQKVVSVHRARRDLSAVGADLNRARLITPAREFADRPAPLVRFAIPPAPRAGAAAVTGLAVALVLLRCAPLRWSIALAAAAARLPGRPATAVEAEQVHAAVRRAARIWPGRAACLEESLATYLTAALTGRRCRWVLGAGFLPQSAHAWVEAAGCVVGQAEQDRVWPYVRVLEVERSN